MNYGSQSVLTAEDKADLKRLYKAAWIGKLTHINGTPIQFVEPYHALATPNESVVAISQSPSIFQPAARAAFAR